MRLIPGTVAIVKLNDEKRHFTLVAFGGDGVARLNIKAPLALLLGAMAPGDVSQAWTSHVAGAETMRVELVAVS